MAGPKKTDILAQLSDACAAAGVTLRLHPKPKKEDGSTQIEALLAACKASADTPVIGTLPKVLSRGCLPPRVGGGPLGRLSHYSTGGPSRWSAVGKAKLALQWSNSKNPPLLLLQEKPQGAVPEAWLAAVAGSGLATSDMAADLAALLSPKDDEEAKNVRKAAYLVSNALTKFAVPQLEGE